MFYTKCRRSGLEATESGSQKVQHHFGGFKHKSETISITKMVNSENSSDLERVAATRSIAVKFSEFTILVIELQRCENTAFHFHAAPFGIRTRIERMRSGEVVHMSVNRGQGLWMNVHTLAPGHTRTGVVNTWAKSGVQTG